MSVVSLFKQRKHKRFKYIPKHLKDSTVHDENLKTQWQSLRGQDKNRSKRVLSLPILLVILGMIIAVWYILTHYETS